MATQRRKTSNGVAVTPSPARQASQKRGNGKDGEETPALA